ncbi:uncharacterized protein LOC142582522 isoform X2 [Dermacentor variabilis]|uniref:uncharacterized protein LOC142582522 isoform X2 n=1 Tax=Dermacentor variabilis TaxID=34621 RepID=UPI003F5B8E81
MFKIEVVSSCGVKNHGEFRVSQFSSAPHGSGTMHSGILYFPLYLRFIFSLGFPPRLHYYCFCNPVFNCGPQAYPGALARLYGLRSKRLLRARASPVPGATANASTFRCQWRPAGRLDLSPHPALLLLWSTSVPNELLHDSTVCAPKDYFGHEHHLFQERLLLLLHSLASGVLLVAGRGDKSSLYYCCGPQAYPTSCCTTLRSALQKD